MPVTKVQLCNLALQELGANRIISLSETREEAVLCNLFYDPVVEEVLRAHEWNCALWYQPLAQVDSGDANYVLGSLDKWSYQYKLPTNPYCLRALEIPDHPEADYEVINRYLLCNLTAVTIKYIRKLEDESHFDSMLVRAIAYRLAADLADKITNSSTKRNEMIEKYEWAKRNAMAIDGIERERPQTDNDDWSTGGGFRP